MAGIRVWNGKVEIYDGKGWVEAMTDVTRAMEKVMLLFSKYAHEFKDGYIQEMSVVFQDYNEGNGICPSSEDVRKDEKDKEEAG